MVTILSSAVWRRAAHFGGSATYESSAAASFPFFFIDMMEEGSNQKDMTTRRLGKASGCATRNISISLFMLVTLQMKSSTKMSMVTDECRSGGAAEPSAAAVAQQEEEGEEEELVPVVCAVERNALKASA